MMKACVFILIFIISITSCKSLPEVNPGVLSVEKKPDVEFNPFLNSKFRLIHSIKASMPGGNNSSLIGITVADPGSKSIQAVLMTVEGLVIFDACYSGGAITLNRGLPPLDSMDFAAALMRDISLVYFLPDYSDSISGAFDDGSSVRRFYRSDGMVVDVIARNGQTGKINLYDSSSSLARTAEISGINQDGVPGSITLTAHGFWGYTLKLDLLEYEAVK